MTRFTAATWLFVSALFEPNSILAFSPPLAASVGRSNQQLYSTTVESTEETNASPTKKSPLSPAEIRDIQSRAEADLFQNHNNNAFNALFVSCPERPNPIPLAKDGIEGQVPVDFPPGCLLRLGPMALELRTDFLMAMA